MLPARRPRLFGACSTARRRGHTLVELAAVLATAAILCAIALPATRRAIDATAVRAARDEISTLLEDARRRAQWRGERVDVRFDSAAGTIHVVGIAGDTVMSRGPGPVHAVRLAADRAVVSYAPTGLGFGAANARIVLARGASADTLWLSRLGRVRH